MLHWSGLCHPHPAPSRNPASSLFPHHPVLPRLCAATGTHPWVPRKPGGVLGHPGGFPPGPSRPAALQEEAGGEGEVTKMPQQQRMNRDPPSSSTPYAVPPFPSRTALPALPPPPGRQVLLASARSPAFSRSPCLSLSRLSLSFLHSPSFPFLVPSSLLIPWSPWTGAEGPAVEVRGRTQVEGGLGVSWYQVSSQRDVRRGHVWTAGLGAPRPFECVGVGGGCRGVRLGY